MALHQQWNGASSSNIRKFTEEERQELREQFASVSVDNITVIFIFQPPQSFGYLCGLIS